MGKFLFMAGLLCVSALANAGSAGASVALVDIDVTVAASGSTATYVSEIRDNNEVMSSQVLTIAVSDEGQLA